MGWYFIVMFLCSPYCQAFTSDAYPSMRITENTYKNCAKEFKLQFWKEYFPYNKFPLRASRLISLSAHKRRCTCLQSYLWLVIFKWDFRSFHGRSKMTKFSLIHWHWYQKWYEVTACWSYQAQLDKPHHPDYIRLESL